jgi:RimJ/RimL family protein N-acetyltransferase
LESDLTTTRLVLEPITRAHAAVLYPLLNDARLYEFLDDDPPCCVRQLEARYDRWSARRSPDGLQGWLNWAARLRDEPTYVGWFQATIRDDVADIAYLVFAPHQRNGYAREGTARMIDHLASDFGVTRIKVTIDPRNTASIRLAEALGLERSSNEAGESEILLVGDLTMSE